MTPEGWQAVQSITIEAIKMIAPAAIAGFVGYKAAKIQLVMKKIELGKVQEFAARENLFRYYCEIRKEIQENSEKESNGIYNLLGQLTGMDALEGEGITTSLSGSMVKLGSEIIQRQKIYLVRKIDLLKNEMEKKELNKEEIFQLMKDDSGRINEIGATTDKTTFMRYLLDLQEINDHVREAMDLLCDHEREKLFSVYLQEHPEKCHH